MPFTKDTASAAGRKGGKATKNPAKVRNKSVYIVITESELAMLDEKSEAEGVSRTELIVRAVKKYTPNKI
jgi:hypothetical protein